jgi:uncharacterized membrane protein
MERLKKIIADTVFVVQILIGFFVVFENRIEVPPVLQMVGRLHPLLLHLPIGLLLVTVVLFFTRRYFSGDALNELIDFLLHVTALAASVTAFMGLLLSREGTFTAEQMWLHKWLGVSLSFICWMLLMSRSRLNVLKPLGLTAVVVLIFAGHFGARLTHGEDFVWAPMETEEPRVARVITDSTALFTATIEPIMESKCYGCHNPRKAKGKLVLTSLEEIQKGGKDGALWKPGDAAHSLIVKKLALPLDADEHMPPKDKAQLTRDEIGFIALWIEQGADTRKTLKEFEKTDTLMSLASAIIPRYQQIPGTSQQYAFAFASTEKISDLSRPNRSVFQIAKNEPAVQADFFLRDSYDPKYVEDLLQVKEQLVTLNLSKMPVKDENLSILGKFSNLETLNLNNTAVTGQGLGVLASLNRLRSVSLSGTAVSAKALRELGTSHSLRDVFIWNTPVSQQEVASLAKDFPHIHWDIGFVPDEKEVLKLSIPLLQNKSHVLMPGEKVVLRHNLPGTDMRYSIDGSDPDSIASPLYSEPVAVGNYTVVKTKAYKEKWLSSDLGEFIFFRKGFTPDSATLLKPADERYKGEGAATLIDGNKGLSNFYRHPAWIAFKDNDLVARFCFEKQQPTISNVTLSYVRNPGAIFLPPSEMQIWGGNSADDLKLIAKVTPPQEEQGRTRIEGLSMDLPPSNYKYYQLVAKPVKKLLKGNPKKRDIWLMVDEVFFN